MRNCLAMATLVLLLGAAAPLQAQAAPDADLKAELESMKLRLREQDKRISELESNRQAAIVDGVTKEAIRDVVREMLSDANSRKFTMPEWADNLKFSGDFRLRYQYDGYDWGAKSDSEKKDRHRARFRLRFGVTKTWLDDQLEVGFRLASGESDDPTSTNNSFTSDFAKKPVWIDLAYAKYSPKDLKGFSITGGKMTRPWMQNEIFFDTDVNPEGFWAEYKIPNLGKIEPFVGAGYFLVKETAENDDTTMYMAQTGVKVELAKDVKYTFGASYQEWTDYYNSGATPRGNDSPLSRVPNFQVINLMNNVDVANVFGKTVSVFGDWAHNCGEDDEIDRRYEGQNDAMAFGIKYGQNKKKGDWSVKYRYAWVQANALPGMFVDSDFGFANRKGHVIGGEYNILDSLTVGVGVYLTEPIFSPSTTSGSSAYENMTATVMADMVWKF